MGNFIVVGITQIETIVKVKAIPIQYAPFTGESNTIYTAAGGDAFNASLALMSLGDEVKFMTVIGKGDTMGMLNPPNRKITLSTDYVLPVMKETPVEVLFYDDLRKQQIFEDLKDIREAVYDMSLVDPVISGCDMVVSSNANFCRPFIKYAKDNKKKLAVKIHSFVSEKEVYNEDFLTNADILYFNDHSIEEEPFGFIKKTAEKYHPDIIILGQGEKGLILYDREKELNVHYDPIKTKDVVNSAGAGNALFACFLHYYLKTGDSVHAIRKALLFAAYKLGYMGTSNGFMAEEQLQQWENLIFDPRGTSRLL